MQRELRVYALSRAKRRTWIPSGLLFILATLMLHVGWNLWRMADEDDEIAHPDLAGFVSLQSRLLKGQGWHGLGEEVLAERNKELSEFPFHKGSDEKTSVLRPMKSLMFKTQAPTMEGGAPTATVTHVYPAYVPRDPVAMLELQIVQASWQVAIDRAQSLGIRVELLQTGLPEDLPRGDSPHDSPLGGVRVATPLTWRALGPLNSYTTAAFDPPDDMLNDEEQLSENSEGEENMRTYPTIGEVFRRAQTEGTGDWVVYTNADIGMMPDFYENLLIELRLDPNHPTVIRGAIQAARAFLIHCWSYRGGHRMWGAWREKCARDGERVFVNEGGDPEAYASIREDIESYAMKKTHSFGASNATVADDPSGAVPLASSSDSASDKHRDELENDWVGAAMEKTRPDFAARDPALVITRVDLLKLNATESTPLEKIYTWKRVARHPGNDCFAMKRASIPAWLARWGHPVGFRPWGWWLQSELARSKHVRFRRVSGESRARFTWHIGQGLWGRGSDKFRLRAEGDPLWTIFAAAHFERVSNGGFFRLLEEGESNAYCKNSLIQVQSSYCSLASTRAKFCQGFTPLSCANALRTNSRDALIYESICKRLGRDSVAEPVCSFCAALIQDDSVRCNSEIQNTHCDEIECENAYAAVSRVSKTRRARVLSVERGRRPRDATSTSP